MELYQLQYFMKVAETEHMTRAARELNLSEPTLSRAIRQLEEELDTKLFERRGRSIALTENGATLQARAGELLKYMEALQEELRGVQQIHRPVRLVSRAAASLVPGMLREFSRLHPEVAVSIVQNDNNIIRNQEYDLMIGGTIIQPPKYSSTVLLDDPFRVLLPPDHPLADQASIDLAQLDGQDMIGLAPNRFISSVVNQALQEQGIQVNSRIYSDDPLMIRNLVELGVGFAIVPAFTLRAEDKRGVRELPIRSPFPSLHLVLSWKPDTYHPEAVRKLRRFIQDYFRRMVSQGLVPE